MHLWRVLENSHQSSLDYKFLNGKRYKNYLMNFMGSLAANLQKYMSKTIHFCQRKQL